MPLYVHHCDTCQHKQEVNCSVSELPTLRVYCMECEREMRRIISKTVFGNATEVAKKRGGK
jgi:putative FmdB family regulatory protein